MTEKFVVAARPREAQGTGASRRLRRTGWTPAIVYGAGKPPQSIVVEHKEIYRQMDYEGFYSHILSLDIEGQREEVVIKAVQRHPAKKQVLHADFLRVQADQAIRVRVPLHFEGAEIAPGVKTGGGVVEHLLNEVEVECLPRYLPEYITVDLSKLDVDETLHLSDLTVPEGVELVELKHENDTGVVSIHIPRVAKEEDEEEGGEEGEVSEDRSEQGDEPEGADETDKS
jgi:large subunit ribosomal protein L25